MAPSKTASAPHAWLWRCIGRLAFNRITLVAAESIPATGPILFVATHRNGAMDAAAYWLAAPEAVAMVSAQLQRSWLGRCLFPGIAVSRAKDRARGILADNEQAMRQCLDLLRQGGSLLIMPEGSSSLGHRHLPFKRGAARILSAAIAGGVKPVIVPLAVHYEDATRWQSRVEVLVGSPIHPQTCDEKALHRLIVEGLEAVGANFADAQTQHLAERLAYAGTLGTDYSYAKLLKRFEQQIPPDLAVAAHELEKTARKNALWKHQGLPLVPVGAWQLYLAYWLLLAPVVFGFCLFNLPVLAAGYIASRTLPDDSNVIAFWRMMVGLPAAVLWVIVVSLVCLLFSQTACLLWYGLVSLGGIWAWYRFRKLSVALGNVLFHPAAAKSILAVYRKLLEHLHG